MPSRFQLYMTTINDQPAWIEVMQDAGDSSDLSTLGYLFCVYVSMREPDPDGFPKINELVLLDAYEHTLIAELEPHQSKCVGRITMAGTRQLFFYTGSLMFDPNAVIRNLWDDKPAFATQVTELEHDPEWQYYFELLQPNPEERQQMANRQRVEQLKSAGDQLLAQRKIGHWFAFDTVQSRSRMIDFLQELRYEIGSCAADKEEKGYVLEMVREDRPDLETISDITAKLMEAADAYEGMYLGWETEVIIG